MKFAPKAAGNRKSSGIALDCFTDIPFTVRSKNTASAKLIKALNLDIRIEHRFLSAMRNLQYGV